MFSSYVKQRIVFFRAKGYKVPTIAKLLRREGIRSNRVGISKFLRMFEEAGNFNRRVGSGRPSKVTREIKQVVEEQMLHDDETTAVQLYRLLKDCGYNVGLRTVLRCRTSLGWTFRGSAYCQHIRERNRVKRLAWAQEHLAESFDDVIWTDECSVQMESHRQFCCRKIGQPPNPKPRYVALATIHVYAFACTYMYCAISSYYQCIVITYKCIITITSSNHHRHKHAQKVHVWAGISKRGRTGICVFEGIMKKELYTEILDATLLPFLHEVYRDGHKFIMALIPNTCRDTQGCGWTTTK